MPENRFRPFTSQPAEPVAARRLRRQRRKRQRIRRLRAQQRGYRTLSTQAEWVAEMRYRPTGLKRDYRVIIKRQLLEERNGQAALFRRYVYRFIITSIQDMSATEVLRFAYGRCNQENTIEQLKNGLAALRMPTGELLANGAFMGAALIAWNLKAWLSLFALPAESLHWEWKRFRHAFVYVASKILLRARTSVAQLASSHRFTPQLLAASRQLDTLVFR